MRKLMMDRCLLIASTYTFALHDGTSWLLDIAENRLSTRIAVSLWGGCISSDLIDDRSLVSTQMPALQAREDVQPLGGRVKTEEQVRGKFAAA